MSPDQVALVLRPRRLTALGALFCVSGWEILAARVQKRHSQAAQADGAQREMASRTERVPSF